MAYILAEKDKGKIQFLSALGKLVLKKLDITFTERYLEEAFVLAYFQTLEPEEFLVEKNPGEASVVDKDDASNLAIALLEALKKYGIKNEIIEQPDLSINSIHLVILPKNTPDQSYNELLGILNAGPANTFMIQMPGIHARELLDSQQNKVENFVSLKKTEFSGEPGYKASRKNELIGQAAIVAAAVLLIAATIKAFINGQVSSPLNLWLPLIIIPALGIFICYQLFQLEKYRSYTNSMVKKICSAGQQGGCQRVLFSKTSKLFGLISMTDIGCVYFSATLVFVLDGLLTNMYWQHLPVLFWCSVIPLPYTLFSIYYQLRVVKTLCVLCISVLVLLWMQFLFFIFIYPEINIFSISLGSVITLLLIVAGVAFLYFLYVLAIHYRNENFKLLRSNQGFKNNTDIFNALLEKQPDFVEKELPGILMAGNSSSPVKLTVILSVSCAPCAQKLKDMEAIADWFNNDIYIKILLRPDEISRDLLINILRYTAEGDFRQSRMRLEEWYSFLARQKDKAIKLDDIVKEWIGKGPIQGDSLDTAVMYAINEEWHKANPVPHTPFIIYNNKALPTIYYERETLINIIEQSNE